MPEKSKKGVKKKALGVRIRFKIRDYRIYLGRNMKAKLPGFGTESQTARFYAQIICTSEEAPHYYLNLYFLRPDSEKMDNYFYPDQRVGASFLPFEQYNWYLDILRNEEPVYGYLNSARPSGNGISTSQEPVGEGEST